MAHTLLHVGATDEALGVAQKARDIAADLAARPEADASVRRALAGAQVEIGDALKGRGEIDGALRSYRDSLTVLQNLSKASPNDLTLRRLAASSFDRVGDALSLQDDFVDALAAFNSSRDIRRALAEADKSTQSTTIPPGARRTSATPYVARASTTSRFSITERASRCAAA